MDELIDDIYEIIKDYREDEGVMSKERIRKWIDQFESDDRVFVLSELKHILSKRYISKEKAKHFVKELIEFLAGQFGYSSPKDFLLDSNFIDHQPEGKSQKVLLSFINDIIQQEYGISVAQCNTEKPKYYIYFDDVLCTGDTLFKGLAKNEESSKGWLFKENKDGKTNWEIFKENKAKLVLAYFAVHKSNIKKVFSRIYYALDKHDIDTFYAWEDEFEIENDVENSNSKLNFLFPSENLKSDPIISECQKQIENKIKERGYHKDDVIIFRKPNKPSTETFFTSIENRERFEKIILKKSIEVYNSSERLKNEPRPKPLGYGLYTDLSFGFGTLVFSWRNVPFNVPLIFWYPYHGWTPLFERKFVTYGTKKPNIFLKSQSSDNDDYGETDNLDF